MRFTCALASLALASIAFAQPATTLTTTAGQFTIGSGSYTTASNSVMGGLTDYSPVFAGDYSFRQAWSYRQAGDSREYNVASPSATFVPGTDTWDARLFKGLANSNTGAPTLQFDVRYELTSPTPLTPLLHANLCVTNLTNAPIQASVFYYIDLDIPNGFTPSPGDDTLTMVTNGFHMRMNDSVDPTYYAEAYAIGATRFQHGTLYESLFTNGSVNNLNNSVTSTFGDLTMGFQWDCLIPPGDCCVGDAYVGIGLAVPEPGAFLASGAPLLYVLRRRKARSHRSTNR